MRSIGKIGRNHFFMVLLCLVIIFLGSSITAKGDVLITMTVDGMTVTPDVLPYIVNDRTMVPIRYAAEPMGAVLGWQGGSVQKATIRKNDDIVEISIGQTVAYVNGTSYPLDAPAEAKSGRTMVPLRFVAEGLNANVAWVGAEKKVVITTKMETPDDPDDPDEIPIADENTGDTSDNATVDQYGRRSGPAVPTTADNEDFKYIGYYYDANSLNDMQDHLDNLSATIHFAYTLTASGEISKKDNFSNDQFYACGGAYDIAQDNGLPALMLVTGFNKDILVPVLNTEATRDIAIANIANIVEDNNLDGVDLDFEAVPSSCRESFVTFVRLLKEALGEGKIVSLSVTAREADYQTWLNGYDYAGLADAADWLIVMCYDQHYSGSVAGPVGGADWMERVIKYMLGLGVPKDKFYVGFGIYGRAWGKGGASLLPTINQIVEDRGITVQYESGSEVPYFTYVNDSGETRLVYYEDAYSVGVKASLVKRYGLAGVALWRMGIIPDDIYEALINSRP